MTTIIWTMTSTTTVTASLKKDRPVSAARPMKLKYLVEIENIFDVLFESCRVSEEVYSHCAGGGHFTWTLLYFARLRKVERQSLKVVSSFVPGKNRKGETRNLKESEHRIESLEFGRRWKHLVGNLWNPQHWFWVHEQVWRIQLSPLNSQQFVHVFI